MATIEQIDANRRNSQLSTGPVTLEGKLHASLNALKSGIYAESTVIPGEDPTELLALTAEYYVHHHPATPEARALVDSLIHQEWLLRRFRTAEAAFYNCDCSQCEKIYAETSEAATLSVRISYEMKKFDHIQRRINATERNFHRSLKALQALEQNPGPSGEAATTPEPPAPSLQPQVSKPTSQKLASFPQIQKTPGGEPAAAPPPDTRIPTPESLFSPQTHDCEAASKKLASFPQTQKTPGGDVGQSKPDIRIEPEIDAA